MSDSKSPSPREEKAKIRLLNFLERLRQEGVISQEAESECIKIVGESWLKALEHLRELNVIPSDELGNRWAEHIGVAYVSPEQTIADPALMKLLPETFCKEHGCLPLYQFGDTVTVAMVEPFNNNLFNEIESRLKKRISPVFSFSSDIVKCLNIQEVSRESLSSVIADLEHKLSNETDLLDSEEGDELAKLPSAIELVDTLLLWSRIERASDIHLEPTEKNTRVRFRVDGILEVKMRFNKRLHPPIVNRLKVLSGADIAESRRPQDGNLHVTVRDIPMEFRFSIIPSIYGERIVLRSTSETGQKSVESIHLLGLAPSAENALRKVIASPNGIFFVTGPTGSGKSTTLSALIQELNSPDVNIMTIEDPVERRIPGISQTQLNKGVGLGFAPILKAFLRQDPDVILLGEIRDLESAKIAAEAALTGHLVFSTLHTNNALQAITRLIDIGVEPFLVAPAIIGVMAQRLLRKLCEDCKQPYQPTQEQLEAHFTDTDGVDVEFYQAVGCEECNQSGYKGRVAIHELFVITDDMRSLISRNASLVQIEKLAAEEGFRSMKYEALKRALRGETSLDEITRIIPH